MSASILSLMILVAATSSTLAAPTPSTLSCHDDICTDGPDSFICSQRRLVCCKGRTNNSFQVFSQRRGFECCAGAGKLFETQREICVAGQVQPRGQNEEICGTDRTYNTSNQVCCGGNVFPKVAEAQCCGNEYLTDDAQSCCNGIKYNTYEQVCCRRLENDPALGSHQLFDIPYGKCCLDKPYDPRNQSCIQNDFGYQLIHEESREIQRCSGERYDPSTHECCRGEQTKVYELRRAICHYGSLYDKTDPHQNSLCVYNYDDDEGTRQQKIIPYTKNSRTGCISTRGVVSLGPLEDICGDQIYNMSTDLCCSGKRYPNMKVAGFQCCISGGTKMFNPAREICCVNQMSKKIAYNDGARCCYREPYSMTTHECRGVRVVEKACSTYGNKCNVSVSVLKRMKKRFVYFGIAGERTEDASSRRRPSRQWTISDLKTLKFKKGKVTVIKTKTKGTHFLKSTECGCPENLVAGARYMFVSSQPVKRKTLSLESTDNGFIIPIEDEQQIGLVFETIIEKSK